MICNSYHLTSDVWKQVWSCGVNDDAALGRITQDVPDPEKEGEFVDIDTLTAEPHPLQSLKDENFRAVRIAAGDTISAAISAEGELRVWGSFRVRHYPLQASHDNSIIPYRASKAFSASRVVLNTSSCPLLFCPLKLLKSSLP